MAREVGDGDGSIIYDKVGKLFFLGGDYYLGRASLRGNIYSNWAKHAEQAYCRYVRETCRCHTVNLQSSTHHARGCQHQTPAIPMEVLLPRSGSWLRSRRLRRRAVCCQLQLLAIRPRSSLLPSPGVKSRRVTEMCARRLQ